MYEITGTKGDQVVKVKRPAGKPANDAAQKMRDLGYTVTMLPVSAIGGSMRIEIERK